MDTLFFLLHVLVHPYCVQLYVEKENTHHSFKELTNFSHQGNKTPWAVSNHSWSLWKTYYYYYKQQVGEESSLTQNAEQGRYSCKANLGWRTRTLQLSTGSSRHKCSIWSLLHEIFQWWILWNPAVLSPIELLRTQESQRKAEGLNCFKRLHCFKQNTSSKNKAGETNEGGKGSMISVEYLALRTSPVILGPKENSSGMILGSKLGQYTINNKP